MVSELDITLGGSVFMEIQIGLKCKNGFSKTMRIQ